MTDGRIVIIGVGNLLMKDDGIGIRIIEELRKETLPPNVGVYDGATRAFDVPEYMDRSDKAVIVDAFQDQGAPGSVYRFSLDPREVQDASLNLSLHDINFIDALKAGSGIYRLPFGIVIIGVEPELLDWGLGFSEKVENAVGDIMEAVRSELS